MVFGQSFIGPALPQPQLLEDRLNGHGKVSTSSVQLSATWHRNQAIGCGLTNLGNSCYLNSVLQCLAHLPPLGNLCLARLHTAHGCRLPTGTCTCCLVEAQVSRMLSPSLAQRTADAPVGIHRSLGLLSKGFVKGRQEDAHELLRCLVDAMERDLLKNEGRYDPHKPVRNPNTLVNALFSGILQSQVRCLSCGHESNTYDPMMDLSLELAGCRSVEEALGRFTAVERLDGANKYRCDGCKQLVPAEKRMAIWDDPNILVVHLKRFDTSFGKITRDIAFSEHVNLDPYMASTSAAATSSATASAPGRAQQQQQQQQPRRAVRRPGGAYVLHGVLIHEGLSANSGHYYAYVRDGQPSPTCKWHCMNDSSVYRVSEARVQDSQRGAYILFYVRTSMKMPATVPEHTEHDAPATSSALKRTASAAASAGSEDGSPRKRARAGPSTAPATYAAPIGPQLPPSRAEVAGAAPAAPSAGASSSMGRASAPGVTRIGLPPRQGSGITSKSRLIPLAASAAAAAQPTQQPTQQQQQQQQTASRGSADGGQAAGTGHANGTGSSHGAGAANGHASNGHGAHSHPHGQQQHGPAAQRQYHTGDSSSGPGGTGAGASSADKGSVGGGGCSWEALKSQLKQGLRGTPFVQAMRRLVAQAAARGLSEDQVLASKEELRKQLLHDARMPPEILNMGKDGVLQHLLAQEQAAGAVQ